MIIIIIKEKYFTKKINTFNNFITITNNILFNYQIYYQNQ